MLPGRRHTILMDATHAAQDAAIVDQEWGDALLGAEMTQMVYEKVYQEVWLTPIGGHLLAGDAMDSLRM